MANPKPCCINLNPDITGIGVRVALYVQILLGWGISLIWPDTFARNARTAYMTATALLIAAFIQWRTRDLSLLDGIVVSLISTMMITFAISSSPTRSSTTQSQQNAPSADSTTEVDPNKSFSRFLTQIFFVAFWAAWCLRMWQDPERFGLEKTSPECDINNRIMIVVFGREIQATDPRMQRAATALVSIGLIIAVGSLFISLEDLLSPLIKWVTSTANNANPSNDNVSNTVTGSGSRVFRFIRRSLQALSFSTLIYLITTIEQTIDRNDQKHGSNKWSYGQTIALILLLQQIMDVCSTVLEKRDEKKWRQENSSGNPSSTINLQNLSPTSQPTSQPVQGISPAQSMTQLAPSVPVATNTEAQS
ncbi:hypothetical protein FRC07_011474 [Ceratobasidium sp. 392]|nr:hypothetical protein FRC07_011474 [Ceratobasidium sp. 392]